MSRRRRKAPAEPEEGVVANLTHDGRGVVRTDDKTVFVHGALPGERVRFVRMKRRRNHDEARLLDVLEASAHRVEPRCEYFGVCGGCALQHLDANQQVTVKEGVLFDNLEKLGGIQARERLDPLTAESWGYRRRARLAVKNVPAKGRVLVGFRERSAPYVADMRRCEVLHAPVGDMLEALSELIGQLSICSRVPQVEVAVADNTTALVFRVLDPPSLDDLECLRTFAHVHALRIYLQSGGPDTVTALEPADEPLWYALPEFDLRLVFEPTDFLQVNAGLNERMVAQVIRLLAPGSDDRVLDLFCGIGNFTLALARRCGHVTGIEGEAALIGRARHNANINGLSNAEFSVADLCAEVSDFDWARRRYDCLLLDPPRAGAREVLTQVPAWSPRRIAYVSCHPGTLARDVAILHDIGYRLGAAGVMDMFPHTAHVEALAILERQ